MLGHPAPESMCDGGSEGTSHRGAGGTVEEEGPDPTAADLPRKRKGDLDERSDAVLHHGLHLDMDGTVTRSEGEDQQAKMQCFRQPHRQIEKRRRDKMNNLIEELSAMIPACQPMAAKPDKLSVLRKAVQHLKALKAGSGSTFADAGRKPPILGHEDLRHLLFRVADGFLLVVSCDRAKMLFISESVSKILNFSRVCPPFLHFMLCCFHCDDRPSCQSSVPDNLVGCVHLFIISCCVASTVMTDLHVSPQFQTI
ncbi:basic helix-loop-helix ARNT-like protein 2 [Nerophis ophidion]|uniref:basic helix-loop-helix ARNT-like protein 2 n=1 Tax=Nerophis ophidion TaxID=159077 RepID=UPI002AE0AF85|nr:basic helix-loop-helix ARNT-like protein 2 [Nerophis ophidion]